MRKPKYLTEQESYLMYPFLKELITELAGEPIDTTDWEKAVLALLIAILILGPLTIWQVSLVAPLFLFQGALAVYILLLALTIITSRRIMWIYPIDGLLGLGLVAASLLPAEHLVLVTGVAILPAFIMIVGDSLALLLGVTSLYVFWKRFSPQVVSRLEEYRKVHENCAPNAPCRTVPDYRV